MPPFGFRKRERSASPAPTPLSKRKAAPAKSTPKKSKSTLFDTADEPSSKRTTIEENRKFLNELDDEDEDSSLSDVESDEFEDVPSAKRRKLSPTKASQPEDEEDDEMDWEDAIQAGSSSHATPAASKPEEEIGDISISMNEDGSYIEPLVSAATAKRGPSKRERQVRAQTHCLHVQSLMWHNTVRNSWLNDKKVQKTLVDGLPEGVQREVRKWKEVCGTLNGEKVETPQKKTSAKGKGKRGKTGNKSSGRDWNSAAEPQDTSPAQASTALLRLLKVLTAYWRKRFTVTAPGLRKQGYKDLRRLRNEIKAWEKDHEDFEDHGERIENRDAFRKLAKNCEGSRDVGAQLFVALLRGIGLGTRMVANLQPVGFGWSKAEEADAKKSKKKEEDDDDVDSEPDEDVKITGATLKSSGSAKKAKQTLKQEKPTRRSSRGNKSDPIDLDDSDSPLSSPPPEVEDEKEEDDDLSVIDITPSTPKKKPTKKYDRDLAFPNFWTEVCDPVANKYYPVDPIVLSTIASNDELLQTFEPRGKKAEKAKQVMCYSIAFSADGTAKDVTIRYLKRHQLPGKTKGVRMPVEKVPVYNRKGKVKKYEEYDWFRTVMSLYDRPEAKRTAADDLEDQTDLRPYKPAKEEKHVEKESLQGYKQSADFVLEPHLRREEAILPGVQPVKTFTTGKGDKEKEYPVYNRSDIVVCKTVESWHKEGRAIKIGEQPLKYVPMRAVTLIRKREMEDAQRETGEKLKQGLYSEAQTDWIIPPPIQDGVIPKNAFGNMDVYVPTMVPQGAVHLPLKGSAKLCRKLEIEYAEACTGFEFGKQRAVPVLTGVVVAEENEQLVRDAWRAEQKEQRRKEDTKRTAAALHWWRKMLLGLRVLERMRVEYADAGGTEEEINPFVLKAKREGRAGGENRRDAAVEEEQEGGGFLPPGYEDEEPEAQNVSAEDGGAGGVLMEEDTTEVGGGFLVEDDANDFSAGPTQKLYAPITPVSLQSMHKTMDGSADFDEDPDGEVKNISEIDSTKNRKRPPPKAKTSTTTRRKKVIPSEDEESSLSDLSDSVDNDAEDPADDSESDATTTPPRSRKAKPVSPRVIVSPQKNVTPSTNRKTRAAKKATPVRSPYFNHSDVDNFEESDSEIEVVKPRRTTSRTKART